MSMYKIIEFSDNGGVAVVLSNWMTPRKTEVFWPPYKDQLSFDRALQKQESTGDSWKLFQVARVFSETDNLEVAYKKAKKAEETSNLETDEDDILPKKRKIILPRRRVLSSEDEEQSEHKRPPRMSLKKKSVAICPTPNSEDKLITESELVAKNSTPSTSMNIPLSRQANSQTVPFLSASFSQTNSEEDIPISSKPAKDSLTHCLISLKEQNKEILSILKTIKGRVFATQDNSDQFFKLPVKSLEELESLENSLDEKKIKTLTTCCKKFGGDGATNRTNRILKELITDNVASSYSFYGKRADKKPFCNLKLRRVIVDAVKEMCPLATDFEVEGCIKVWLKHAPQRLRMKIAKENNNNNNV